MARPPKSDAEKLSKSVAFRLTDGDFAKYKKKFSASGSTQSEFFRIHVLENTTQVIAKSASSSSGRAVLLLSKASNNLNQLAHLANAQNLAGKLSDDTFKGIRTQLERLNEFMLAQVQEANQ